ncbi:MAG: tRNA (guanosine(37)-N1)-methyltransferase TrmD [Methylococcaceae bacterium]|nr:tRNA (guanosine(37)-N1)-methyltransferase TrmD [Methylococcaceae bacterium]
MRFDVLTLFPEMVKSAAGVGITGKALERGIAELRVWNPREFTVDKHITVDDRPYGGGPGMLMKYQPVHDALIAAKLDCNSLGKVIYLSPQGKPLTQALLAAASKLPRLILIAGRYEGIDERFIEQDCDEEWSIGDFVLSGGELGALVVIDAIVRLLPGALGDEDSAQQDSHVDGLLDCPHYTRPERVNGVSVPEVLLSGNHADISRWRMKQALGKTWQKRPDLLQTKQLTEEQKSC